MLAPISCCRLAACLLAMLMAATCSAYPSNWKNTLDERGGCSLDHPGDYPNIEPREIYGQHPFAAVNEAYTTFEVTPAAGGSPVSTLCAGQSYNIKMTFLEYAHVYLTTPEGSLTPQDPTFPKTCKGSRWFQGTSAGLPFVTVALTAPCKPAGSSIQLRTTASRSTSGELHKGSLTIPVTTECEVPDSCNTPPPVPAVTGLTFVTGSTACPSGYKTLAQNLNQGVQGGKVVKACVKVEDIPPEGTSFVSEIKVMTKAGTGTSASLFRAIKCGAGYTKAKPDLNVGMAAVNGKRTAIAACIKTATGAPAVKLTDVAIGQPSCPSGYTKVGGNLNQGTKGAATAFCIKKA